MQRIFREHVISEHVYGTYILLTSSQSSKDQTQEEDAFKAGLYIFTQLQD